MFSTLKWKLIFWQTLLFSVILGLGLLVAYNVAKNLHIMRSAEALKKDVQTSLRLFPRPLRIAAVPHGLVILSDTGEVVYGTIDLEAETFQKLVNHVLGVKTPSYVKVGASEYLVVKIELTTLSGKRDFFLLGPTGGIGDFLNLLARTFWVLWAVFSASSLLLGGYFVVHALEPMRRITEEIKGINASDLTKRVYDPGTNDEVSVLAKTINGMLDRLEAGFEAQNEFLNDVSHELRTPLTTIQGYAELILNLSDRKEVVVEAASTIAETAEKLTRLTDSLLALSKPVTKIEFQEVDLREFAEQLAEEAQQQFAGFTITVEGVGSAYTDPNVLEIVVKALLENAVKFSTDRKEIILRCEDSKLSVKDFGIGIEESEIPKIFRRFYKVDKSRSKGGYGLGLSIVDKLVKMLNAKIEVKSKPNEGSEFTIVFPQQKEVIK